MQAIQLQLPPKLQTDIDYIKSELKELKKNFQPKEPTKYLSRNEVAEMFSIDLSTVHNWTKKGKLIPYGLGGRIYYKRKEVENSLIELKN